MGSWCESDSLELEWRDDVRMLPVLVTVPNEVEEEEVPAEVSYISLDRSLSFLCLARSCHADPSFLPFPLHFQKVEEVVVLPVVVVEDLNPTPPSTLPINLLSHL